MNSIKARLDILTSWLARDNCDIVLIQETKSQDINFPVTAFEHIGWNVVFHGQKSYNGVAIASRYKIEDVTYGLPGDDPDEHARYMEATVDGIRVATIYSPNGNPAPGPKFDYKLDWLERLEARAAKLLEIEMPIVLGGDYNIIPEDKDCFDPAGWVGDSLTRPESRAAFRRLIHLGYTDALRSLHPSEVFYTYWDYQAGAWQRDHGIRIDHFLLSAEALDRLEKVVIDRDPRGLERPSDHTPILCDLRS